MAVTYYAVYASINGKPAGNKTELATALRKKPASVTFTATTGFRAQLPESRADKLAGWLGQGVISVFGPDKDLDRTLLGMIRLSRGKPRLEE
jgi:hypothetical protein